MISSIIKYWYLNIKRYEKKMEEENNGMNKTTAYWVLRWYIILTKYFRKSQNAYVF